MVFLKEKRHQSLAKQDKIKFLNEPMQTAKQIKTWCQHDAHQQMCDLSHVICRTTVKQLCSTLKNKNKKKKLFYGKQHKMPLRNNRVKQNRLEDQN